MKKIKRLFGLYTYLFGDHSMDATVSRNNVDLPTKRKFASKPKAPEPCVLDIAIASLANKGKLTFIQVGANDGKLEDPIYQHVLTYGSKVLLIEPQPWLMGALRENYVTFSGNLLIENIAIGPEEGILALNVLKQDFWDEYISLDGRSPTILFTADRLLLRRRIAKRMKVGLDEAERRLQVINVPMHPLSNVLTRHGIETIDVLQVDCEGWDVKVVLSLGHYRPALINIESLSLSEADKELFIGWCKQNGYGLVQGWKDTLAIRGFSHPK